MDEMGQQGYNLYCAKIVKNITSCGNRIKEEEMKKMGFGIILYENKANESWDNTVIRESKWLKNKGTLALSRYPGSEWKNLAYDFLFLNISVKYSKDDYKLRSSGFGMPKNHILFKIFKTKIQQLVESGIMSHKYDVDKHMFAHFDVNNPKSEIKIHEEDKQLEPLTLTHLEAGFVIWIVTVIASIFVYFGEIITHRIGKMRNNKVFPTNSVDIQMKKIKKIKNKKKCQKPKLDRLKLFEY